MKLNTKQLEYLTKRQAELVHELKLAADGSIKYDNPFQGLSNMEELKRINLFIELHNLQVGGIITGG